MGTANSLKPHVAAWFAALLAGFSGVSTHSRISAAAADRTVRVTGTIQPVKSFVVQVPRIQGQGSNLTLTKLVPNGITVHEGELLAEFDEVKELQDLRDAGAKFVCADMPETNELAIGIIALAAQNEREAISRRTGSAADTQSAWTTNYEGLRAAGAGSRGCTKAADANRKAAISSRPTCRSSGTSCRRIKSHRGIGIEQLAASRQRGAASGTTLGSGGFSRELGSARIF